MTANNNYSYLQSLLEEVGQRGVVPLQRSLTRDEIQSVAVSDCSETLIRLGSHPKIFYLEGSLASQHPFCRERLATKLLEVADILPEGLGLGVKEMHRPVEVQKFYRDRKR